MGRGTAAEHLHSIISAVRWQSHLLGALLQSSLISICALKSPARVSVIGQKCGSHPPIIPCLAFTEAHMHDIDAMDPE